MNKKNLISWRQTNFQPKLKSDEIIYTYRNMTPQVSYSSTRNYTSSNVALALFGGFQFRLFLQFTAALQFETHSDFTCALYLSVVWGFIHSTKQLWFSKMSICIQIRFNASCSGPSVSSGAARKNGISAKNGEGLCCSPN